MMHSSKQLDRENEEKQKKMAEELEYAKANSEYLERKKSEVACFHRPPEEKVPVEKNGAKKYFCLATFVIVAVACYVIYYFVMNIKDAVYKEYLDKSVKFKELLPKGQEELQKSLDQGEKLFDETSGTINDLKTKYDQADQTYQQGKEILDQVQSVVK